MNDIQEKIRYRLVFNRSGRLNKKGEGLVQVECQQGTRRIYFSTKVYIEHQYWDHGFVVGHELSVQLNTILRRIRIDIERTVQRMLGHTKVQTTQIYAEVTERTIEKDVSRLDARKKKKRTAGKPPNGG